MLISFKVLVIIVIVTIPSIREEMEAQLARGRARSRARRQPPGRPPPASQNLCPLPRSCQAHSCLLRNVPSLYGLSKFQVSPDPVMLSMTLSLILSLDSPLLTSHSMNILMERILGFLAHCVLTSIFPT